MGNNNSITNQKIVKHVDLQKYEGKWFEIARKPAFFESNNSKNVTAEYKVIDNNKLDVTNYEEVDKRIISKHGIATVEEPATNSKLSVQFDGIPFPGQYWIVRLGGIKNEKYEFSVVSCEGGKYLWILNRKPFFKHPEHLEHIINDLKQEGYNLDDLIFTTLDI